MTTVLYLLVQRVVGLSVASGPMSLGVPSLGPSSPVFGKILRVFVGPSS